MYTPTELIQDIQARLDLMVRQLRLLTERNNQLETENKALATSLKEAVQQQETLSQKLDAITQHTVRDTKGLENWKNETRKEIKGIMKDMEKCLPQIEALLDK